MKTITQLQHDAVENILALGENGKRAAGYGMTLLNKKTRGLGAIRRKYFRDVIALEFTEEQARVQWSDVKDYAKLCSICEDY